MKIRESIKSVKARVKKIYQKNFIAGNKKVVFILGCQRSGTTLMCKIFSADTNSKVFGEKSRLTIGYDPQTKTDRLSHKPFEEVKKIINATLAPLVIIKPLVESQNALTLLSFFKGSKVLWIYRHFKDVAASNLKNWGQQNGINNLRHVFENMSGNWRTEYVPEQVHDLIQHHYSENMNPYDAAALFWYVRNWFYFELNLGSNFNVMIFRYDHLVTNPIPLTKKIYHFIGRPYPRKKIVREVRVSSVGRGSQIQLSPEVENLCSELLAKLDSVYHERDYHEKPVGAGELV